MIAMIPPESRPLSNFRGPLKNVEIVFSNARIFWLDIYDKSFHDSHRIKTYKGSLTDRDLLGRIVRDIGGVDIVIDDGSHIDSHVIETFQIIFLLLNKHGIYAIEDLQTSYWETDDSGMNWGGSRNLASSLTSMNYLKRLADGLNYQEFLDPDYQPSYFDQTISSLHFYRNLAFIYKV